VSTHEEADMARWIRFGSVTLLVLASAPFGVGDDGDAGVVEKAVP